MTREAFKPLRAEATLTLARQEEQRLEAAIVQRRAEYEAAGDDLGRLALELSRVKKTIGELTLGKMQTA